MRSKALFRARSFAGATSLVALATITIYCSGGGSGDANGADGGPPGVDGSTSGPDGGTSPSDASVGDGAVLPDDAPSASAKPNIIFFLTDDLSWDLVAHMANVQKLQAMGTTFSRYFVTDSLCCPSRSSIFTGKYPHNTGVLANAGAQGGYAAFEDGGNSVTTFATTLEGAGYKGQMLGKYLNGYDPKTNQKDPGWTEWGVAGNGYPEYGYLLNRNGVTVPYGDAAADYLTDVLHGMAMPFIVAENSPFVLEVASFAPHAPYTPAPQDIGTYDAGLPANASFNVANTNPPGWLAVHKPLGPGEIKNLDGDYNLRVEAVQAVDRMIGDVMNRLATSGLAASTYVVFSSDNGYHMGQHTLGAGKQTAFDTDINVPLIVVGPGVPAGVIDAHLVENIDLCPTFAELGGAPALATADGHSLVPLLQGKPVTDWRNVVLIEHKGGTMDPADPDNPNTPDGGPGSGPNPTSYEAIRMVSPAEATAADTVFVSYVDGETEYYNITADPLEMNNTVASLPGAKVAQLQQVVSAIKACKGTTACWAAQHM